MEMTRFLPLVLLALFGCARQEQAAAPTAPPPPGSASAAAVAVTPSPEASPGAADISNPESFTVAVLKLFQSADAAGNWTRMSTLTLANRTGLVVNLDRLFDVCQTDATVCPREVRHFVKTACEIAAQTGAKATPAMLVALVRDRSYLEGLDPAVRAKLIWEPWLGELIIVYAVDLGSNVRGMQEHDLADAGISRQELPRIARNNVEAKLGKVADGLQCHGSDVTALKFGNYLESSRLLLSDAWSALAPSAKGSIVAAVPAADVLLFVCKPDADGLGKLQRLAESFWQTAQRRVSRTPVQWSAHGWTELGH
jgi:uncharacterized protein YtpQ (UPF0354 family)